MLVLSMREGEKVHIGNDIEICVLRYEGNTVKVGFEAPKHVNIVRDKVKRRLEADGIEVKGYK